MQSRQSSLTNAGWLEPTLPVHVKNKKASFSMLTRSYLIVSCTSFPRLICPRAWAAACLTFLFQSLNISWINLRFISYT